MATVATHQPELLFQQFAAKVCYWAVPVYLVANLKDDKGVALNGQCWPDRILLRDSLKPYHRCWVLFHELAHLYLHQPSHGGVRLRYDQKEFEADWTAHHLYLRYGFPDKLRPDIKPHQYDVFALLSEFNNDFYARRVVLGVEKIWHLLNR